MDRRRGFPGELLIDDRLDERAEEARRILELHAERTDLVDEPPHRGIAVAKMLNGDCRVVAEHAVTLEERHRLFLALARALDVQHAHLGGAPAVRGKAADAPAGREHAVTRHDDGERVLPEGLPDGARAPG